MYRIELSPGDETVFRSIEELAVAIKRGVVTPRARIFHNASSKWLPIQFHPHYKAAVSMPLSQAELVAGPQAKPLSSLNLEPAPDLEQEVAAPVVMPPPQPPTNAAPPAKASKPKKTAKPLAGESRSRRRSKPRRQLRVALIGALLLGGAQWVLSVPLFSRAKPPLLADLQRELIQAQTEAMKRVGSPNSAGMIPALPSVVRAGTPEVLKPAPEPPGRVTAPSFGGTSSVETATVEIEAAPAERPMAAAPAGDSLAGRLVDSTSHKALQGILTTVSGSEAPLLKTPPKR